MDKAPRICNLQKVLLKATKSYKRLGEEDLKEAPGVRKIKKQLWSFWIVVSGDWEPFRGEGFQVVVSGNRKSSRSWKGNIRLQGGSIQGKGLMLEVQGVLYGEVEAH